MLMLAQTLPARMASEAAKAVPRPQTTQDAVLYAVLGALLLAANVVIGIVIWRRMQ